MTKIGSIILHKVHIQACIYVYTQASIIDSQLELCQIHNNDMKLVNPLR